jgi:hypothetical protein
MTSKSDLALVYWRLRVRVVTLFPYFVVPSCLCLALPCSVPGRRFLCLFYTFCAERPPIQLEGDSMKFWLLLLLSAVIADGSVLDTISPDASTKLTDFSEKTGYSLDRLEVNVQKTVEAASNIRGAAGIVEDIFVSQNLIAKIRFPDGQSWAAKWGQFVHVHEIFAGINSLFFLENCCPNIPIAKQKGWNRENDDFFFYFTEWTASP